jgi:hypothetical protein
VGLGVNAGRKKQPIFPQIGRLMGSVSLNKMVKQHFSIDRLQSPTILTKFTNIYNNKTIYLQQINFVVDWFAKKPSTM